MKLIVINLFLSVFLFPFLSCQKSDSNDTNNSNNSNNSTEIKCGIYNGHQLYKGPDGGCYYYNSNSNKTYVDRSNCNC